MQQLPGREGPMPHIGSGTCLYPIMTLSTLERLEFFVDGAVYEYVNPIDSSQLTHELQGFFAYPIIANGMP